MTLTPRPVTSGAFTVLLAFGLFAFLFLWAGANFWLWLTFSVLVLCCAAFLAEPADMRGVFLSRSGTRSRTATLLLGIGSAALLYGVFFLGNLAARRLFPFGAAEIEAVYSQGVRTPRWIVALVLLAVVGPGEEIFWRGYVQRRLTSELGGAGLALSILAYTGVHLATANLTLILAALVCGVFWALLYRLCGSLWINIVSHALWAVAIFVVWPVR
jgi:membrane protease YdiL (CAAX protease family)